MEMDETLRWLVFAALDNAVTNGYGAQVRGCDLYQAAMDLQDYDSDVYDAVVARGISPTGLMVYIQAWRDADALRAAI